jgi:mannose-6-phosphate isomerase-like protein (cupin superfamily)
MEEQKSMRYAKDATAMDAIEVHEWGCAKIVFYQPQIAFSLVEIYSGYGMPRHLHEDVDQFCYVVSGEGETVVGNEHVSLKAGTAYQVPATTEHETRNPHGEPLIYVEVKVPSAVPANLKERLEGIFPSLRSTA